MPERSNSLEYKMRARDNIIEAQKQCRKIRLLNSRAVEELGNNPTEKQLTAFKSKYELAFTSLGDAIENNPEATDGRNIFRWKDPNAIRNKQK
jgi:hypothetical protein